MIDPVEFGKSMGAMMRDAIANLGKTLGARIDELEAKLNSLPPPQDVKALIAEAVPAKGEKGDPGESVDPATVKAMVDEAVQALPKPQDGKSVSADEVLPPLMDALQKAIAALPVPKDGEPGKSVTLADIEPLLESMYARWALDFERRAHDTFQRAIDRMPAPKDGKDGRDAFQVEDFELSLGDDRRTVTVAFKRGEASVTKTLTLPTVIYRNVYKDGESYEPGDLVTWGGSLWHCNEPTTDKPELTKAWTLAAKRGRDGRDGKDGSRGEKGDPGPRGRDLTQLGPDGSKW
jgi:hypothetical protein